MKSFLYNINNQNSKVKYVIETLKLGFLQKAFRKESEGFPFWRNNSAK